MKTFFGKWWAVRPVRFSLIGAALLVFLYVIFGRSTPTVYETAEVVRGSVIETVTATGQLKPKAYASLRFKSVGTIARMPVAVGDTVSAGQTLAVLDMSELSKRKMQAEADAVAARVTFANAEQDLADQKVKNEQALSLLYTDVPTTLSEILNLTQQVYASFVTFFDSTGRLTSSVANLILSNQLVVDANNAREAADDAMVVIRRAIENFPASADMKRIDEALSAIHEPLQVMQRSLTALVNAVAAIPTGAVSATTLDGYKTLLATARDNSNSAVNKEVSAASGIRDEKIQGTLAINSKTAAQRSAQAGVEKAVAALAITEQSIADAYLRAPFAGTVAAKSKQIGELVTTADQVFYLLGDGGLEVIANIPEVDIARIRPGTEVSATFDAFSADEKFALTVESIEPDQTTIDGVVYYKTHFVFAATDPRFKSGMSVNLTMISAQRDAVLIVPRRAVTQRNGTATVRVLTAEQVPEVRTVTIGLRGDMQVEIKDGLAVGERVITAEKKNQ